MRRQINGAEISMYSFLKYVKQIIAPNNEQAHWHFFVLEETNIFTVLFNFFSLGINTILSTGGGNQLCTLIF